MNRRRPAGRSRWEGVGLSSGEPCAVELAPGEWGDGLVVVAHGDEVRLGLEVVEAIAGGSRVRVGGGVVNTVEHLLSALVAMGVSDARLVVEGGEIPWLDGSALPFARGLAEVGLVEGPPLEPVRARAATVEVAGGLARWMPRDDGRLVVTVHVSYDGYADCLEGSAGWASTVGLGSVSEPGVSRVVGARGFTEGVAVGRSYVLERDVAAWQAGGRGRGATAEDCVIVGPGPTPPLRHPREPVLHKLLDAIGDCGLVGQPITGELVVVRGSHRLHLAALREAFGNPAAPSLTKPSTEAPCG